MAITLQARVVYPVDQPPIEHGVVTIDGERIVAVGTNADASAAKDLGDVALLPGLVNAHTHLEFSFLKQPLGTPGMRLADWIRLVIAERGRGDVSPLVSGISGLSESLRHGVTLLGDIVTADIPFCCESIDLTIYAEVIGFSRSRAVSCLTATIERLNRLQLAEGGISSAMGHGLSLGISPHAPYTVSPFLLQQLVELAQIRSLPVAMHVAESADELEFLRDGTGALQQLLEERSMWDPRAVPRGSRPLDYLRMLAGAPRALVIHGNYLDAEEQSFLAENRERVSLVYCPRTHAYFGHSNHPLQKMLAAGVRVVLGTDSRASNPGLDLLGEMRQVARSHSAMDPQDILRMGTLSGAEALGRATNSGTITSEKLANLVTVPLPAGVRGGAEELLRGMLADDQRVSAVWVRGELVR